MKFIKSGFDFKMKYTYDDRKKKSSDMIKKYPDKVCVILEKGDNTVQDLDTSQFVLNKNVTVGHLIYMIREGINIAQYDSIYIFIEKGYIPISSDNIGRLYDKYADQDGFLYMTYCREKTFG